MLLILLEHDVPIHSIIYFDSGWDFPQMKKHLKQVQEYTGRKIDILRPKLPFNYEMIEKPIVRKKSKSGKPYKNGLGWPQGNSRWCTFRKRNALLAYKSKHKVEFLVGYAADETHRLKKAKTRREALYPLIRLGVTEDQALEYCLSRGFDWEGLYNYFKRVSCFCCPQAKINDFRTLRKYFPELWKKMMHMDSQIEVNNGIWNRYTVHDLDKRFRIEEKGLWRSRDSLLLPDWRINL